MMKVIAFEDIMLQKAVVIYFENSEKNQNTVLYWLIKSLRRTFSSVAT